MDVSVWVSECRHYFHHMLILLKKKKILYKAYYSNSLLLFFHLVYESLLNIHFDFSTMMKQDKNEKIFQRNTKKSVLIWMNVSKNVCAEYVSDSFERWAHQSSSISKCQPFVSTFSFSLRSVCSLVFGMICECNLEWKFLSFF